MRCSAPSLRATFYRSSYVSPSPLPHVILSCLQRHPTVITARDGLCWCSLCRDYVRNNSTGKLIHAEALSSPETRAHVATILQSQSERDAPPSQRVTNDTPATPEVVAPKPRQEEQETLPYPFGSYEELREASEMLRRSNTERESIRKQAWHEGFICGCWAAIIVIALLGACGVFRHHYY